MTDPADFLSRWARRKRDAARGESAPEKAAPPKAVDTPAAASDGAAAEDAKRAPPREPAEREKEPKFDLSKLPSIESITAETDIRPFLTAGVPAGLRQAALRRVWSADPKIRDFIEMAENQWDFTAGGDAPGFDFATPTGDVRRMVAEIFGERPENDSRAEEARGERNAEAEPDTTQQLSNEAPEEGNLNQFGVNTAADEPARVGEISVENANNKGDDAPQINDATQNKKFQLLARRPHGGAMPK